MLFTGCIPSATIGYAEVTVNIEYVPVLEYWNTVIRELVPSDTRVQDRLESVISSDPQIASQPLSIVQQVW